MTLQSTFYLVIALLLLGTTTSYAQDIEAAVLFKNGEMKSVTLNRKAFTTENMLVASDDSKQFPLAEVSEVSSEGNLFVPIRVILNIRGTQPGDNGQLHKHLDTLLLLQNIIKGSLSLYYYIDHAENEHIFLQKGAQVNELYREAFDRNGKNGYKDLYKGILKVYLADCPTLGSTNYDKVAFSLFELKKLVKQYNQACGQIEFESKPVKIKLHGGLLAGYIRQKTTFNGGYEILDFGSKQIQLNRVTMGSPIFGAFLHFPLGRTHEKLYLELKPYIATSMGFSNSKNAIGVVFADSADVNYTFKAHYYNFVMQLRYNFISRDTNKRFYLSGGLGFHGILQTSKNLISVRRYNGNVERFYAYDCSAKKSCPRAC
ncbi:MAG: hypothetical protein IPN76_07505 [Saprospiraceae bacterium]|nr:hypothetical protein [Saprospiraceae bacterium]